MSNAIVSSNRSPAEWAHYRESNTRTPLDRFAASAPSGPTRDLTQTLAADNAERPNPFAAVVAVDWDQCPILAAGATSITEDRS